MDQQQDQNEKRQLQELAVARAELFGGDTSGLVYVRSSPGAAFLVTPRREAVKKIDEKVQSIQKGGR